MRVEHLEDKWSQEQLITGVRLSSWMNILSHNGFQVSPDYLHRVASITGLALPTSALARLEDARYGRQIATMDIRPTPLFIVGHWRSGTTHMHNLLGRDPNHTYSTLYQCVFPDHFLTTGDVGPRLLRGALSETRSYDNVAHGWDAAAEDEIALMKLTDGLSFYTALMFPDQAPRYEKYIDFLEATPEERRTWKRALEYFIKKVMIDTDNKRVVVKSCAHSARIRLILDLFPDAKFVHIHRHPARTFRSMLHMRGKVDWENFLHRPDRSFVDARRDHTATIGERLYTRLIEDRALIPEGNLVEVRYDDLVGNELEVLRHIYGTLRLPDWDAYEHAIKPYLDSIAGYKVNKLTIDPELEEYVYDRWRIVYDTYGYAKEYVA
jgi:omega-hydroxy-beta-dihydromenaquinone-9 sulfotransferase